MRFCVCLVALCAALQAQTLAGTELVKALRKGGYVIVMRHASSPRELPGKDANPDNPSGERQLDADGRAAATAFGKALRRLKIPVGEVLTSPTYRALETVHYADLRSPRPQGELGEGAGNMQGVTEGQALWLRKQVMQFRPGTNTILITHLPNIAGAFPDVTPPPADGEALVFGPTGIVARIKITDWPRLRS